jgi:NAD(P)-dependent dehydrogenase (short-subunit alcohol dehydrogenase family)
MHDVLGYEGHKVVVTGAASGMGAAATRLLGELGAEVIGLDRAEIATPVSRAVHVDLLDAGSIAKAVAALGDGVDALFSCAGLPGPPSSEMDVMLVNFVGGRELVERTLPRMNEGGSVTCVASAGGVGWQGNFDALLGLLQTDDPESARAWLEEHEDVWGWSGYAMSKQAINAWVAWRSVRVMEQFGVRLNCTNPGPTDTAMMPFFHEAAGKDLVDMALGPVGRYSTAEEQAWAMVLVGSPRASYVVGESLFADGGFHAALQTAQVDFSALTSSE